jgi:hypothetical protein
MQPAKRAGAKGTERTASMEGSGGDCKEPKRPKKQSNPGEHFTVLVPNYLTKHNIHETVFYLFIRAGIVEPG